MYKVQVVEHPKEAKDGKGFDVQIEVYENVQL